MLRLARKNAAQRSPTVASFPIVQFIAHHDTGSTRVWEDPRLGWRDLCPAAVEFFPVSADHENLFAGEGVEEIATRLEEPLRRANGPAGMDIIR
jgi:hypothetical protein